MIGLLPSAVLAFGLAFDVITARVRRQPTALLPEPWAIFCLGVITGLAIAIAVASIPAEEPDPPEPPRPVYIVVVNPAPGALRQNKNIFKKPPPPGLPPGLWRY